MSRVSIDNSSLELPNYLTTQTSCTPISPPPPIGNRRSLQYTPSPQEHHFHTQGATDNHIASHAQQERTLHEPATSEDELHTNSTCESIVPNVNSTVVQHQVHWEGYVRKKGDWLPRWEERYLILDGVTLTYYNSKEEARNARNLRGKMIVSKVVSENYGKAHGFLFETQGHKQFHLCCHTQLEKDLWIEMMQAAIEQVKNTFVQPSAAPCPNPNLTNKFPLPLGSNDATQPVSMTQVHLRSFYLAFRDLLISHSASPQFFPKLSRDIVLSSNYAPTVPFWGEYHGLDGVLHFFSILYETVEFTLFFVTDIAQAQEGCTAVVAGRECMRNRENGRKFTQQWQHTLEFAADGRVKSLTIQADPIAASAVFGCNATSSLSLPMAVLSGATSLEHSPGTIFVKVFGGEQLQKSNDHLFLGMRISMDGKNNVFAPKSSASCSCRTEISDSENDPKWDSEHALDFPGSSRGKPCFMLVEAWKIQDDKEYFIGVAKVNLAPFLALESSSQIVRESVVHAEIARGAIPQWYTLVSSDSNHSCGRIQLSIHYKAQRGSERHIVPEPAARKTYSSRDIRRDHHYFQVGDTKFDIPKRYQLIKAIGQGAYGCVIAVSDTETGQALAIKNVPNAFNDLIDAKRILREIRLMRHLNHPNLVNLVDLIRPPSLHNFDDVYIVTDLMETDLHRVIHSNQTITDEHIQYFLYQMLVAVHYVHSAQVLHRDLKPSNILVNSDCDLKLCDFGLARGVHGFDAGLTEYVVTRWYRAPELLLSSKYDKQVDVWAIGCILSELLGRRPLFPGHDYLHQLKIIMDVLGSPNEESLDFITNPKAKRFILRQPKKPQIPLCSIYPRASPTCIDLLEKMLVFDPRKRCSIEQALEHPYLASMRDTSVEKVCESVFDFRFEDCDLTKKKLQELIFKDVCHFHPEAEEAEEDIRTI